MQKNASPSLLRRDVLAQGADVVAEVFGTRRLDAGEDAHVRSPRRSWMSRRVRSADEAASSAGLRLARGATTNGTRRRKSHWHDRRKWLSPSATWTPDSWRERRALQQPEWPDPAAAAAVVERLKASPPLVFAGEARALREQLAKAIDRRAFLLQAGDCVESFNELSTMRIREKLKIMLQMSAVLTYGATLPVVKVGRIAGQFTKPRSDAFELVDGEEIPSFRGHMVNGDEPHRGGARARSRSGCSRATTSRPRRSTCCARSRRAATPT